MKKEDFFIQGLQAGKDFKQITKEWSESPYSLHREKSVKQKLEEAVLTGVVYDEDTLSSFIDDNGSVNDKKFKAEYMRQVRLALRAAEIGIRALTEMRNDG